MRLAAAMGSRRLEFLRSSIDRRNNTSTDQILLELKCVERLKSELDYANSRILKNFQLILVMDEEEG